MIEDIEQERMKLKEEVKLQKEKKAWEDLMYSIGLMGAIPSEPEKAFYRAYHKNWEVLFARAVIYAKTANLYEKYGLGEGEE